MAQQRKTKQEWHAELQARFVDVTNRMIQSGCPLPGDIVLYHAIHERVNRDEHSIAVETFLTRDAAQEVMEEDEVTGGGGRNQWRVDHHKVVESTERYHIDRMYI